MSLPLNATAEQRAEWCHANGLQVGWLLFTEEEIKSIRPLLLVASSKDALHEEIGGLKTKLQSMTEWKDAAYQTISDLRDAAYGKDWSGGKTQDETIGQVQRLKAHFDETTSIAYHLQCAKENGIALAQLAAAKDIADLIRPRVKDEVKDGRGTMAVFDRARMEALAKALAAFDGEAQ